MKKSIVFFFILFSCTFNSKVQAQKNVQARIDSLETILIASIHKTGNIATLHCQCRQYQQKFPNKVNTFLEIPIQIAIEFKPNKHIVYLE